MKKLLTFLLLPSIAYAQQPAHSGTLRANSLFMVDVTGIPFQAQSITYNSGTPFNKDVWQKGTALFNDGKRAVRFVGKLNLLDGRLHYIHANGAEYIAEPLLKEITLADTINGTPAARYMFLPDVAGSGDKRWQQVLDTGKVQLCKLVRKRHVEEKPFNSATTEHSVVDTEVFYLLQATGTQQIKSTKDLVEALPDKHTEVENFIKGMGRGQKLEERLTKAVHYYNSLSAPGQ